MRLDLDAKRVDAAMKKTERELHWHHEKFEVDMRLQQKKLEMEEKIARDNKTLEEDKIGLQMTMDDKERSRQHDLDRLRLERSVPIAFPGASSEGFILASAVKFFPKFDDSQVDFYLKAF